MLHQQTIQTARTFLKTARDTGAIPPDQHRELLAALRTASKGETADTEDKPPSLLRTAQVAERLGCSTKTVLRLGKEKTLEPIYLRPGNAKSLRWRAADVDLNSRKL